MQTVHEVKNGSVIRKKSKMFKNEQYQGVLIPNNAQKSQNVNLLTKNGYFCNYSSSSQTIT